MTRVMDTVLQELRNATAWLSTNDLVVKTGNTHSSVGRALRRLWTADKVTKLKMKADRYGRMQWATPLNGTDPLFMYATSPTPTVYAPTGKRKKKAKQLATITPINSTVANNQGALIMQIEQGVEEIVTEFVKADKKFTAHDVTKELRDRVNAGTIQVDPGLAGTAHVGGKDVTKIEHALVRDAVHSLMTSGKFPYDRSHTGQYFEYFPAAAAPPATDPNASSSNAPPSQDGGSYDGNSTL